MDNNPRLNFLPIKQCFIVIVDDNNNVVIKSDKMAAMEIIKQ